MINVVGLGYIGLPTALMFAAHGVEVVGTDYNKELVDTLNEGKTTFEEDGLDELFQEAVSKGIRFSHEYQSTDMYIVAVPTPYDKASKKVDASYVVKAVQNVMSVCPKGATVVIESTVSPGTINKYVGFLRNIDEFELLDGAAEAIRKINESGYLAIVATNQPVIARGEVSFDELEEIHNKMETLLGKEGAYLDAIYYCPHHPHKGYDGERPELKIDCDCRKPKPGMLLKAASDFNIDLSQSWMVGDGENDIKAGINAGCKTALIGNGKENLDQMMTVNSLLEFAKKCL